MNKYIRVFIVIALVVAVVMVARNSPAWASSLSERESWGSRLLLGDVVNAPLPTSIQINGDGNFNIGGVCTYEIDIKDAAINKLLIDADAEVPIKESMKVPFSGKGELFYPGCHFVYNKDNKVVDILSTEDADAKVCFGANPDMELKIYYYMDNPENGYRVWSLLPSTIEDDGRLVCAPAYYTGVYMPAGYVVPRPDSPFSEDTITTPGTIKGTVVTPPFTTLITESGTYTAGGVCMLKVEYRIDGLSDALHVEPPAQDTLTVPFPGLEDLLYFPGCHVIHYRDSKVKPTMTRQEGDWEICFAARPGKEMTIYYYRDDLTRITPPWLPLETTTENGMACANLVDFSAVYTPAGK